MKFYDVALRADLRTEADLENLVYFGLQETLVVCGEGAASDDAFRVLERFDRTQAAPEHLLEDHGIVATCALGLRASSAPRRAHPEIPEALKQRAATGALNAVGPLEWPDESGSSDWHFAIAAANGLPVLVEVAPRTGEGPVRALRKAVRAHSLEPTDVVMLGGDFTNVRAAAAAGFWFVADLSPGGLGWEAGAQLAERFGNRVAGKMMLSTSSHSSFDVLAAARFAERVRAGNLKPQVVEGILWSNAQDRFAPR